MKIFAVALVAVALSTLAQAQNNWSLLFGQNQTSTSYYNPVGSDATRSGCSDFLSRDYAGNKGCYPSPYYHLGQDMIVKSPTTYSKPGIGHQVRAIADGEVMYISYDGWGKTSCTIIKKIIPSYACSQNTSVPNVAVFVKHRATTGDFLAVYGHIIDYNLITKQRFEIEAGGHPAVRTMLLAGQSFAVLGDWAPPHLHLGIYPSFNSGNPKYPSGNKGRGFDIDASKQGIIPTIVGGVPETFGLTDPFQWLTTTSPVNYISGAQQQVSQIGVPPSLTVPLGGVGVVQWQGSSLQGFSGTIQGTVTVEPDLSSNNLQIQGVLTQPQTLNSQQTINIQSMMYVPSTVTAQIYTTDVRTASIDGFGKVGSTPISQLALQVFQPNNTTQTSAPVINTVGFSGTTAVNVGTNFTVYVVGSSIDPGSVQALLNGPGCSTTCGATNVDVTNTSYVGTFDTPTQPEQSLLSTLS